MTAYSAGVTSAPDSLRTLVLEGRVEAGSPDWIYLPVEVPAGVSKLAVRYSYDRPDPPPGLPGNALDIGIFDERGHTVGGPAGLRGWSGGARDSFEISPTSATPGYVPGPVNEGTWQLLLAPYTVLPDGFAYRVEVGLHTGEPGPAFVPSYAPDRALGRGRAWYRGDLHLHTVHSDGQLQPDELVAAARSAGLDFVVSTEHNTPSAAGVWGLHARDDLLLIDGEEVTTRNGHLVAAGLTPGTWIDWRYRAGDRLLPRIVAEIRDQGGLAIAAHPFAPCLACAWKFGYADVDAIEVWNGTWTPDDEVSLRAWDGTLTAGPDGRWTPAVGSSDFHGGDDQVGCGQTVVLADDLSREAILAGIRVGRCYVAESADIEIGFAATAADGRSAGIGERLTTAADTPVTFEAVVRGVEAGFARFVTDGGALAEFPLSGADAAAISWTTTSVAARYVRLEIRRPAAGPLPFEPMAAFTNPIFLDAGR